MRQSTERKFNKFGVEKDYVATVESDEKEVILVLVLIQKRTRIYKGYLYTFSISQNSFSLKPKRIKDLMKE